MVDEGLDLSKLDFVLLSQWDGYSEELIPYIKSKTNAPVVYWAFDHQARDQDWHLKLVENCDLYLSKRLSDGCEFGDKWRWLSQDFAPKFLDKVSHPVEKDIDVLFTGSYLPWATERNETLKAVDEKFNLVIHSVNAWEGFKDVRPPIMDEGLPELYARAKVILSIDHTLEAGYWSDRNAQIMCCGGRPLFRYVPLSEVTFHQYVDYFYDIKGCLSKIEFLLKESHYLGLPENHQHFEHAQANLKATNRVQDLLTIIRGIL